LETIFKITYQFLKYLEAITGFTYREINIIIWFFIIPFVWLLLLDKIKSTHKFKIIGSILIVVTLLLIPNFNSFSNQLFLKSQDFLNLFNPLGSNYVKSSVIICVVLPILVTGLLIKKAYLNKLNQ